MNNSMFGDEFSGDAILGQNNNGMNDMNESFNQAGGMNYTPAKQQVPQEPCLLPCTIKQILNAPNPQQDESFYIDGRDTTKDSITIVGRTISLSSESTHRTYTIDDGTGQLDVRFWSAGEDDANPEEAIPDNTYVRVIGKLKLYGSTRSMTGFDIRKIIDFDEITYHNLDVIHTHLINTMPEAAKQNLQKQKLNFNNNNNNNNNRSNSNNSYNNNNNGNNSNSNNGMNNSFAFGNNNNNNAHNGHNGGNAGMNTSMMSSAGNNNSNNNGNNGGNNNNNNSMMVDNNEEDHPPLHRKILAMLERVMNQHQNDENYQGCHVDTIFDQLRDEDRNQIREALEQMSSDGHIFSTIDDETYNISQ